MNKKINNAYIIFIMGMLTAFPSISIDTYLPAIPMLQNRWNESMSSVNRTLSYFFISYCISLLVYGPLSDQFGRKKPLLTGIYIYIAASLMCAVSKNIQMLIIFRVLQAAGAAAAFGLSIAMCKDMFEGSERAKVLALVNVVMCLSPIISPFIGSFIILTGSWRYIFILQAVTGAAVCAGVFAVPETLKKEDMQKASETFTAYAALVKNRRFTFLTLLFTVIVIPHFAFIGASSNIYIKSYGLSEQIFSIFFAVNGIAIMAGSYVCSRISHRTGSRKIITAALPMLAAGGAAIFFHIIPGAAGFALLMAVCSFSYGLSRPAAINIILEQVKSSAGAASSMILFVYFLAASFTMRFISFEWDDRTSVIGITAVAAGGAVFIIWAAGLRKKL